MVSENKILICGKCGIGESLLSTEKRRVVVFFPAHICMQLVCGTEFDLCKYQPGRCSGMGQG